MKRILLSSALSMAIMSPSFADTGTPGNYSPYAKSSNDALQNIQNYLSYLGNYLGYDITKAVAESNASYMINYSLMFYSQGNPYAIYPMMAAIGSAASTILNPAYTSFTPSPASLPANSFTGSNSVFGVSSYSDTGSYTGGNVGVSTLIDQQASGYQPDPTSQALQNIFFTPDASVCPTGSSDCMSQYTVMENVTGMTSDTISKYVKGGSPLSTVFTSQTYFNDLIPQLNASNLLGPLQYQVPSSSGGNTSSPTAQSSIPMLSATSQAQQAQNFVRFATGQATPMNLPSASDLQTLSQQLVSTDTDTQTQATQQWAQYVSKLSTYASQVSVAYDNLNTMMAKRMQTTQPKSTGGTGSEQQSTMSQAQAEYQMATWRLYSSNSQASPWMQEMQNASPSTVSKEQLSLLAEINYQLYLNRQMQERVLLTNSILLLQNAQNLAGMITLNSGTTSTTSTSGNTSTTTVTTTN